MTAAPLDGCTHDPVHLHGEVRTYRTHRCRCDECRAANTAAQSALRRRKAYGLPNGYIDATETREHLDRLVRSGLALSRIRELTGIDDRSLARLLRPPKSRQRADCPGGRITTTTRDRILAVAPARYLHEVSARAFVPALGTIRRLNALAAVGWSTGAIAREAGLHPTTLNGIRAQKMIVARSAAAVARAYERLWDVPPPDGTRIERMARTRAIRRAEANGWPPPMAWDDGAIDMPSGRAAGVLRTAA